MINSFLGKPNRKIQEFLESKIETKNGKWTLFNPSGEEILVLDQYSETLSEKKWCKKDDTNTFIVFGSARGAIIPHWMFYSSLSLTLNPSDPNNGNLKEIKATKSGETGEYVFKWSKGQTPPTPTNRNIKFTTTYSKPEVVTGISVITDSQAYGDIAINGSGKDIPSGTNISYFIELSRERPYPVIRYINGEMVEGKQTYQSPQFTLTEDTTITVGISDF